MNDNKGKGALSGLISLLILSAAARQGGEQGIPTLEEMLAGGRQKGKPIDPIADFMMKAEIKPFSEAPEELKQKVRADILAGKVEVTEGCECEFCTWVVKQPEWTQRAQNYGSDPGERFNQEYAPDKTVPGILREAAQTYEQRNPLYGDAYKHYGSAMMAFFPQGLFINEPADWNRFGLFSMMVSKMTRIANNITVGGHRDSSLDLSVYAAMMTEMTEQK